LYPPSFHYVDRMTNQVVVVGGGASGMMAAGRAAERGADVLLLEKTPRLGNKLRLTGKGRCNLTNEADRPEFILHFGATGRFLHGAFSRFFVSELVSFFSKRGVPTVVERGGRVFPRSNDARQVVDALEGYLLANKVQVQRGFRVEALAVEQGHIRGVLGKNRLIPAVAVILATGGASYPRTGSDGDGYRLATQVGHSIVPIRPALVPLVTEEEWVQALQGLSLRNVEATLLLDQRPIAKEFGEMLFTHFGVSGPIVLTMSKLAVDALPEGQVSLSINLKPAVTAGDLDRRLQEELGGRGRRQARTVLAELLPKRMVDVFLMLLGIPPDKPGHQVTSAQRKRMASLLQDLRLTVVRARPIDEAIVTAGGINTDEINPRTLESRLVKGLFFSGEVMDIDADTGGYNLQAAFSTGFVAGESAAQVVDEQP